MKKERLIELFEKFTKFNILIVGDVMIDTYFWGTVERISPEAPVPIISRTRVEHRLGGAANVAQNIKSLGANPILCSVIGNDDKAELLTDIMKKGTISTNGILKHASRITTVKTRVMSDNHHLLRIDEEIRSNITEEIENEFISIINSIIEKSGINAIIFQDYDKGVITPNIINSVVKLAKTHNIPTLVDPKKRNFKNFKGVDLFKPNFKELVEGLKLDISKKDTEGIFEATKILQKEQQIHLVMTTLSELGVFISDGKNYHQIPAEIRDIADVSGAGDTVVSTASLCLAAGLNPREIAWISNISGGLVCEKVGVVPIEREQLLNECLELALNQ
ncbi:MAG: bifunctional ADP-heptose synthase [Bacteroidales bacterium]